MTDTIKMHKLPGYSSHRETAEPIGQVLLETSYGPVMAVEAPGITTMMIEGGGKPSTIAVLVYMPQHSADPGMGLIVQVGPEAARNLAASLLHLANAIDGGAAQ